MRATPQLSGAYIWYILTVILFLMSGYIATAATKYVKPTATGSGSGLNWANASGDLQLMINNSSSGDQIWVAAGNYVPNRRADATGTITTNNRFNAFVLKTGVSLYGGFAGTELVLSQRNFLLNVTRLSGDIGTTTVTTDNCYHVLISASSSGEGRIDGFSISNGYADNSSTNITVNGQTVRGNRAGGIYIVTASPVIENCIISRNTALDGAGCGGAFSSSTSSPVFNNCTFTQNNTSNALTPVTCYGGGIYVGSTAPLITKLNNCSFTNNSADAEGGGAYVGAGGNASFSNCLFSSNNAFKGGALAINTTSVITVADCQFVSNTAIQKGGALYDSITLTAISNSTFTGNNAPTGGAILNYQSSPTITNSSFKGNTASLFGGAIHNTNSGTTSIINCLIAGNTAPSGAGISTVTGTTANITNSTIVSNRSTTSGAGIYINNSTLSCNNSICWGNKIGVATSSIFTVSGTTTVLSSDIEGGFTGAGNINSDPLFISPQPASASPTSTGDYHLQKCSPIINAGNNALIPSGITTDLDAATRIKYTSVDMGCYEYNGFVSTILPDANGIVYVDISKSGNGSSWLNAAAQLSDVLLAAKYNTGIAEIWVAKGTYKPQYAANDNTNPFCAGTSRDNAFVMVNNVKVYGGFSGGETNITQRNIAANTTILSGDIAVINNNTDNCFHVLVSAGAVGTATLDGFTVTAGQGEMSPGGSVNINSAGADRSRGGGILTIMSSPLITNCTISSNTSYDGGGMSIVYNASPTISNCAFISNTAGDSGGGIDNAFGSGAMITNCSFLNNVSQDRGGGLVLALVSSTINACIFSGNTAPKGGGVFMSGNTVACKVFNSMITGNSSLIIGAALYSSSSLAEIVNCTIAANQGSTGSIIANDNSSNTTIKNSIVWGNAAGSIVFNDASSSIIITYSDIEGGYSGTGNVNTNPLFINPQPANTAPTTAGDYRVQSCSQVIDAGLNTNVPAGLTTDLDGNARILNVVDLGSYEKSFALPNAAGIVYVDRTKNGNGSTWTNAVAQLADALKAAKFNSAIKQIWVAKGTYSPFYDAASMGCTPMDNRDKSFVLVNNVKLYGGFAGGETDTSFRNFTLNETTLSGDFNADDIVTGNGATLSIANNTENAYHVVINAGGVSPAIVDGFTVRGGNANGTGSITVNTLSVFRWFGGGIYNHSNDAMITQCTFIGNATSNFGAALNNQTVSSASIIKSCHFIKNKTDVSPAAHGAGICNSSASPLITGCSFNGNLSYNAGGIFNDATSTPTITLSSFTGNAANVSSGVYISNGSPAISSCSFISNNSTSGSGGAMMISAGSAKIDYCIFKGNSAINYSGGGIFTFGTPVITNCLFTGNAAAYGGAIEIGTGGLPTLINCTIGGNRAITQGGGIYGSGGGINLKNSVVWGNNTNIMGSNVGGNAKNCIVEGGYAGSNILNANPRFIMPEPAANAPTENGDYRLDGCSAAINFGDNADVPATSVNDLDDNTRIAFGVVDAGCWEIQSIDFGNSTWKGVNTNWNDKVNWCGGYIPSATTNVTIPSGLTNYPIIGSSANNDVRNIILGVNSSININLTAKLTINGTYTNSGSTLLNNGTLVLAGNSANQNFPGSSAIVNGMNNLEIKNPSGITFNKSFSITGILTPTAGNINVNNVDITLKSSAAGTASVGAIQPAASITHTGSGSFIVERFINTGTNTAMGQHAKSWQFLATPTLGQSIFQSWQEAGNVPTGFGTIITGTGTGFDITTALPSLKSYNDNLNLWEGVTNTGNSLQNKKGYMLYVRGDRTVTSYLTNPNNTILRSKGIIYTPLNPPPAVSVQANKFQSVGNPYPSRIEFSKLLPVSSGINDVFYVWDPKVSGNYQSGAYQTLSGITGYAPTVGASNSSYPAGSPNPNIESGQAFFVRGNSSGGNMNFNESVKATGNRLVTRSDSSVLNQRQFLYAYLYSQTGMADGNVIAFENGFGNEVNELDAIKMLNGGENFGLRRSDSILAVEAHNSIDLHDTIFYHLQNLRQQNYQLKFAPLNMADITLPALLIDKFTGAIHQIDYVDSSIIDFTVTADSGSFASDRFMIVFNLNGPVPITSIDVKAYRQGKNIDVEWQTENNQLGVYYEVEKSLDGSNFSFMSRIAASYSPQSVQHYISIDTDPSTATNYYRIRSTNSDNQAYYSSIVKVGPLKNTSSINICPNPVVNRIISICFSNMPSGKYKIRIVNSSGQVCFKKDIQHQETDVKEIIQPKTGLSHGDFTIEVISQDGKRYTEKLIYLK